MASSSNCPLNYVEMHIMYVKFYGIWKWSTVLECMCKPPKHKMCKYIEYPLKEYTGTIKIFYYFN